MKNLVVVAKNGKLSFGIKKIKKSFILMLGAISIILSYKDDIIGERDRLKQKVKDLESDLEQRTAELEELRRLWRRVRGKPS